jgi:hypothetical protein
MVVFGQHTSALVKPPEKTIIQGGFPGDTVYQATLTIGMLAPLFLEWTRYEMRRAPSIVQRYGEALQWVIRDIGDQPVTGLHMGHLLTLRRKMETRGCREARIAAILHALRAFLKFCGEGMRVPTLSYREIREGLGNTKPLFTRTHPPAPPRPYRGEREIGGNSETVCTILHSCTGTLSASMPFTGTFTPRSRGCGPQQRILSCCPPLIPGLGNAHSITDEPMVVLDTMDLEARDIVHRGVHEHHWCTEGKHHSCRGRGGQTFIAGDLPLMLAEIEAHLPLDHGIHQQPHDREHGQRCNPFRFLQPYRADGSGILDPAKARFDRDMLFLIGLEDFRIRTHL